MFKIIESKDDILNAQTTLENSIQDRASKSRSIQLGYQGGGHEVMVHHIPSPHFWIGLADAGNRYWNALGLGNPFKNDSTIIAEINPPKSGINRRVSGAFVRDAEGSTYLAHRGRVGGGRKGIGKQAFMAWYPGKIVPVRDGDRTSEMILIGKLEDGNIIEKLAAFTRAIATFKDEAVSVGLNKHRTVNQKAPDPTISNHSTSVRTNVAGNEREAHLLRLYSIIDLLAKKVGGPRILAECNGYMEWPERGVYFFMENGEVRSDSGNGLRIVRVGTHALSIGARTKLWTRLSQHQGVVKSGGGNHRGSIFRLIVGAALCAKPGHNFPSWGQGSTAAAEIREKEISLEREVSEVIGSMPFIWLPIADEAGPDSERGYIERNSISLLSNYIKPPLDLPSSKWLGHFCNRERVRNSGLWNSRHVDEP